MPNSGKKVCFMTGASGKLGSEIALSVANEGYSMFFTWSHSEEKAQKTLEKIRKLSPESQMVQCDVSKVDEIEQAFATFSSHFDRLDLLITSASNFYRTNLLEVTESDWDNLVDTNLKGTFFMMQVAAKIMLGQPFTSRIITMTDVAANMVWPNHAPYTVSKSGIQHLTRIFARQTAPTILVNSVAPGTISAYPDKQAEPEPELLGKIPLQRFGQTSEITEAIRFLMNSDYITGQMINVDGGRLLF